MFAMLRNSTQESFNDYNYWKASAASSLQLIDAKPKQPPPQDPSPNEATVDGNTAEESEPDEDQILEALIRSEMGDTRNSS